MQIEQGSWSIAIAPSAAVERTFTSRKLDLNAAYAADIRTVEFPMKKGSATDRICKITLNVTEPGFENIERDVHMGLPQPIPQGADEKTVRSLIFAHELWYNLILSLGYQEQQAKQIVASGINAGTFANAPGRGRVYIYVEADEYTTTAKDPVTKQPVIDPTTGAPRMETKMGEDRKFCSPNVWQRSSAAAARAAKGGATSNGVQGTASNGGFAPPAGFVTPAPQQGAQASFNAPAPQVPNGGFAAPAAASPFVGNGVPAQGGFGAPQAGPMGGLMQPRA